MSKYEYVDGKAVEGAKVAVFGFVGIVVLAWAAWAMGVFKPPHPRYERLLDKQRLERQQLAEELDQ